MTRRGLFAGLFGVAGALGLSVLKVSRQTPPPAPEAEIWPPIGTVYFWLGDTPPSGWAFMDLDPYAHTHGMGMSFAIGPSDGAHTHTHSVAAPLLNVRRIVRLA